MRVLKRFLAAILLSGCDSPELPETELLVDEVDPAASEQAYLRPDSEQFVRQRLEAIYLERLQELLDPADMVPRARSWLDCDGYITNNASAGFCEASPPADWMPRTFNGQRLYFVPLGGA